MTERSSLGAPGRVGVAELIDPRVTVVRADGRSFVLVAQRLNQRLDARLSSRAHDSSDARAVEGSASVSHPHGEASGPGAWNLRTAAKKTRFGGACSHFSDVLVCAFVSVRGNRGETAYESESVSGDSAHKISTRGSDLC